MGSYDDNSANETHAAIMDVFESACLKDDQLRLARQEWCSLRAVLRRFFKLLLMNAKGFRTKMLGTRPRRLTSVQQRYNEIPSVVNYAKGSGRTIAHFIPTLVTGGSQQLVVDLIENLPDYNHVVVTGRLGGPDGYEGIEKILLGSSNQNEASFSISNFLSQRKPDLMHVHFWATIDNMVDWRWYRAVFNAGFAAGLPIVQNCNNPTFPFFDERISRNVFVSHYAANVFGLRARQSQVIYPGSNFSKFKRVNGYVASDTIGMVYRLEKDKLNEVSIEPFIEVVKRRPTTKVLIVGGGSWFEYFSSRIVEEGLSDQFEFTGYVPYGELPRYYSKLSLFVAPVHKESFGQVTPFAMNMGIPVVGFNVGALAEIIGNQSLLAPAQDVGKLTDIICDLLDDKARMKFVGEENEVRARSLFSLESMIQSFRQTYQGLLQ
jgi:glycosyltransferase involved in cell wall biosynthesis